MNLYNSKLKSEPECNPDDNGKDPDSSNDENDLEDYNDDEVVTNDDPQENTN